MTFSCYCELQKGKSSLHWPLCTGPYRDSQIGMNLACGPHVCVLVHALCKGACAGSIVLINTTKLFVQMNCIGTFIDDDMVAL